MDRRNFTYYVFPHRCNMFADSRDCLRGGVSLGLNSRGFTFVSDVSRNGTFSPMCNRQFLVGINFHPSGSSVAKVTVSRHSGYWIKLHFRHWEVFAVVSEQCASALNRDSSHDRIRES